MRTTRRDKIRALLGGNFDSTEANASLWLDKFIFDSRKSEPRTGAGKSEASYSDQSQKDETAKAELVEKVISIKEPVIYKDYFEKTWTKQLDNFGAKYRYAKVKNRLAINLGSESVLETNIALHRVFGVPFIAGSSLKGMTAAFIRQYGDWKKNGDYYITVFGDENNAGFITFYDALYIPNTGFADKCRVKRPLYVDVMTTHHQDYYGGGAAPPTDWGNPNPVPFISATGEFLIALSAPEGCEDWLELTFDILGFALAVEGMGAKTSSGYGRMRLESRTRQPNDGENRTYNGKYEIQISGRTTGANSQKTEAAPQSAVVSESERIAHGLIQRITALKTDKVAGQIKQFADECLAFEDESARRLAAKTIKQKVVQAKREKASAEKDWFKQILILAE